jgi:PAS domain S-box-containing protein
MTVTPFPTATPLRVLIIEDTDVDARVIEAVLRQFAFDVRRASTLAEARMELRSEDYDVILSDLGLPDSDDLDTLYTLLDDASTIPVVVMTGRADESTALRAVAAGAQDYLVKGNTDANTLLRAIRYAVERGRATEEISLSETRMRTILEGALDAVVSINHDGRIVRWNRSAEEIFGWPRNEVLGRELARVIVPERHREHHRRALERFLDTGAASLLGRRVEWSALRRDGTEFPVEVRITAEADGEGVTFTAFIADITERKRAEEERIAAATKFRALVEHASDVIFLCDADGRFTYVSPAVTRMLGYAPAELLGSNPMEYVHPEDLTEVAQRLRTVPPPDATPTLAEYRFLHRDGSWRNLEVVRANRLDEPAVRAIVGNVRDVTARRQTQEALDGLRRRYELILNSICDGVYGIDLAGTVNFENPAAAAMLGWQPEEMVGQAVERTTHHSRGDGSAVPVTECPIYATLTGGGVRNSEDDVFWRKDGTPIRVEYTSAPMVDERGDLAGAVVTFRDITRQKQLEQQLEQSARVASLGRVSASVAHEFNNLLMGLAPAAEVMKRKTEDDPLLQKTARQMLSVVRRGQRLTEEILRFTNPAEPQIATLDVRKWFDDFAEEAASMLVDRELKVEMPEELSVRADADQISQVMLNLVANARAATSTRGGTITVGAAPASSIAFLREQLAAPGGFAALYVRDDGCGISAAAQARIFEPFYTTSKRGGTGLGLAVAWRIVTEHGGHIAIDSERGKGSTFYVVLPSSSSSAPA